MGTNTLGLLAELVRRGDPLDLILFGDTGGEFPRVYEMIPIVSAWLVARGYPPITVVRHTRADGSVETLEDECLRTKRLPSIAYGSSRLCSGKYKIEPQDKFLNHWEPARETWAQRERVIKLIGYDVDERYRIDRGDAWNDDRYLEMWDAGHSVREIAEAFISRPSTPDYALSLLPATDTERSAAKANDESAMRSLMRKIKATAQYEKRYPLVEWGWGRDDCLASIDAAGIPRPGKTACFFCSATRLHEIRALPPEFATRSLRIEDNAETTTVKGLGRSFAWRDVLDSRQGELSLVVPPSLPCACVDGDSEGDQP